MHREHSPLGGQGKQTRLLAAPRASAISPPVRIGGVRGEGPWKFSLPDPSPAPREKNSGPKEKPTLGEPPMTTNAEALLAYSRARQKTVTARVEAARAKLGGETASGRHRRDEAPPLRSSSTAGLSAEELERDAASIKRIMSVWRRIGKR